MTNRGPVDRVLARVGLKSAEMPRQLIRAYVPALLAWLPLLALALVRRRADDSVAITFLEDIETHVRFLIVVPLLILAESGIGRLTGLATANFVNAGLIAMENRAQYDAMVRRFSRALDSPLAEAIIAILAAVFVWTAIRAFTSDGTLFWFEKASDDGESLTVGGWWYAAISFLAPFLFLRWAWRYAVWCSFLFRVSRQDLRIVATHPDRAAGLGFVSLGHAAFARVAFAASAMVAATVGTRLLYEGARLATFQLPLIIFVVLAILVGILPLLVFSRPLRIAKERALLQYGRFASRYVRDFDHKWIGGGAGADSMDAADDIQALADIGGSFERVENTRILWIVSRSAIAIAIAVLLPMLPLVLMVIPLVDLLKLLAQSLI